MFKYSSITAGISGANFTVLGDGESKVFKVALSVSPFSIDFKNNPPNSVGVFLQDDSPVTATGEITIEHGAVMLIVTFNEPPDAALNAENGINVGTVFEYASL